MNRCKYTQVHKNFIVANGRGNNDRTLTEMFNAEFGTALEVTSIISLRYRLGAVSGLKPRRPNSGCFKKGETPFNKGLTWDDFMSPEAQANSHKTTFKKGHTPKNHKPVGSERMDYKNGVEQYIKIKVAEPDKHALIFLDGNRRNCSLDNLALIEKAVALRMNREGLYLNNKELTKLGLAIAKVETASHKRLNDKGEKG